jgi:DNA-binding MarR family transcriptional regulator
MAPDRLHHEGEAGTVRSVPEDVLRSAAQFRACLGPLVRRMRQVNNDGVLTLSQVSMLARLDRCGPTTPGSLAAGEQISRPYATTTLATLQAHGFVTRVSDPMDRRQVVVTITELGRSWIAGYQERSAERLARTIADRFTADERAQLFAAIPLLERLG